LTHGVKAEDWCDGVRGLATATSRDSRELGLLDGAGSWFASVVGRAARARTAAGGIARSERAARLARPKGAPLTTREPASTTSHVIDGPAPRGPRASPAWGPVGTGWGHGGDQKRASGAKSGGGETVFRLSGCCFRRSCIPHRSGGQGVAGSNPASPTTTVSVRWNVIVAGHGRVGCISGAVR
jgi:hypothetical protein